MALLSPLILAILAALSFSPASFTPERERSSWNRPVPDWWQGPVRYALTDEETKAYRSLSTLPERASFIARFWAARDADPYAPGNLAEETFWQRVSASDELFQATTLAGWRTDRGRVYILLGPPDEITNYNLPSVSELDPTHVTDAVNRDAPLGPRLGQRGAVEWVYRSLPDRRADSAQTVTFVRDEAGEFVLSRKLNSTFRLELPGMWSDPTVDQSAGGAARPSLEPIRAFNSVMRAGDDLFSWGQASLFEKMDASALGRGGVRTSEFFGVIPVRYQMVFLEGSGGTNALMTLGIPELDSPSDLPAGDELEIFGTLQKVNEAEHSYQFSARRKLSDEAPTQQIEGVKHRLYEVRGVIPPGDYHINFGARIGSRMGGSGDHVRVPDFGGEDLAMAGPVLAEKLGKLSPEDRGRAFAVGQIKMVPKLEATFAAGSNFGFYFQIYHAHSDPSGGKVHLDIQYSVASRVGGIYRTLGKPVVLVDSSAPAHAYLVPLEHWSPGEYLLTVTGQDRIGGGIVTGTAAFRVR
jgi:GWxTD domain-containing protein